MPERIQLRRAKGWRKPEGAVVVTRPGKWGNPFRVVRAPGGGPWEVRWALTRDEDPVWVAERDAWIDAVYVAVEGFSASLRDGCLLVTVDEVRRELAGRELCCSCSLDAPCHADVLLEIANAQPDTTREDQP